MKGLMKTVVSRDRVVAPADRFIAVKDDALVSYFQGLVLDMVRQDTDIWAYGIADTFWNLLPGVRVW